MKRLTQCICFLLICAMLLPTAAMAASVGDTRASSYFATSSAYLVQTGNMYEICCSVTATGLMDELGFAVIKVQRRLAGSDDAWETRKTFTKEDYPHLIDYDQATHATSVTYGGLPAYEYRAYLELYAKKGLNKAIYGRYAY